MSEHPSWDLVFRYEPARSGRDCIEVRFGREDQAATRVEIPFQRVWTDELCSLFEWYYQVFRSASSKDDRAEQADRATLALGRALGERLADGDEKLRRFAGATGAEGIERLRVSIVSEESAFLAQPWELLVLPGSSYVLSAAAASFARTFPTEEMKRAPAPATTVRIVRIIGDEATENDARRTACALGTQTALLSYGGALEMRLCFARTERDIVRAVETENGAARIVHLSAQVKHEAGIHHLKVGLDGEPFELRSLFAKLGALGVELAILDLYVGSTEEHAIRARLGLDVLRCGIGNVVLLRENADAATREACFAEVYASIAAGHGLRRGMVEARKRLQKHFVDSVQQQPHRPNGITQSWPLLLHYSLEDVVLLSRSASAIPLDEVDALAVAQTKMFGFAGDFLRAERFRGGEGAPLRALANVGLGRVPVLVGKEGSGKTRSLHATAFSLVLSGGASTAFYWDCAADDYSVDDAAQMIAAAIGSPHPERADASAILEHLATTRAVLAFDNFSPSRAHAADLAEFVALAAARGALCLVSCASPSDAPGGSNVPWCLLEIPPLHRNEAIEIVSARALQPFQFPEDVGAIVEAANGNPFRLTRLVSLCSGGDVQDTVDGFLRAVGTPEHRSSSVRSFYQWRWSLVAPHWQRLLLACLDVERVTFDLLALSIDSAPSSGPYTRSLWPLLRLPEDARFADAIAAWDQAGFLVRSRYGRRIDANAMQHLRSLREPTSKEPSVDLEVSKALAAIVCGGCFTLFRRLQRHPQNPLLQHLFAIRGLWAASVERLWLLGEHATAAPSLDAMVALFGQAGSTADLGAWAMSLLERTDPNAFHASRDPERLLACLTLARTALLARPGWAPSMAQHVAFWSGWVEASRADFSSEATLVFDRAFSFLQRALDQEGDLAKLERVCRIAEERYASPETTPQLVSTLEVLAACEHELGHRDSSEAAEHRLLRDIDYTALPKGTRQRVTLDLAQMRLRQREYASCERLLDSNPTDPTAIEPSHRAFDLVRAELDLEVGRHELGAARFSALWRMAVNGGRGVDPRRVAEGMKRSEAKLGSDRFRQIYREHAGDNPTPEELQRLSNETTRLAG